jgi:hypothetical protein
MVARQVLAWLVMFVMGLRCHLGWGDVLEKTEVRAFEISGGFAELEGK